MHLFIYIFIIKTWDIYVDFVDKVYARTKNEFSRKIYFPTNRLDKLGNID